MIKSRDDQYFSSLYLEDRQWQVTGKDRTSEGGIGLSAEEHDVHVAWYHASSCSAVIAVF